MQTPSTRTTRTTRTTRKRRGDKSAATKKRTRKDDDAGFVLPTELALGSDGRIYVNAEGIDAARLKGRKMFYGYALTQKEAARALLELHRVAFNITIAAKPAVNRRKGAPRPSIPKKERATDQSPAHPKTKAHSRPQSHPPE